MCAIIASEIVLCTDVLDLKHLKKQTVKKCWLLCLKMCPGLKNVTEIVLS